MMNLILESIILFRSKEQNLLSFIAFIFKLLTKALLKKEYFFVSNYKSNEILYINFLYLSRKGDIKGEISHRKCC